jgi:hypothetical protein
MKKILATILLSIILLLNCSVTASAVYGIPNVKNSKEMPFQKEVKEYEEGLNKVGLGSETASLGANLILKTITNGLLYIAAPVAIVFIAYGGLSYITAMGQQEGLEAAKKTIIWGLLGLLLIIMSYGITRLIISLATSIPGPSSGG